VALLPGEFSDLEPFAVKWSLATEPARWAQRLSMPMEDLHAFYDASLPRAQEAIAYCDTFPLDDLPDDAVRLLQLIYSFVIVSFAVELWGQQYVPDTRGTSFDRISEPVP
jgi:hypothetical protein